MNYVLSGSVFIELDFGETELRAGDLVVVNGDRHAWHNRSSELVKVLATIVGAHRRSTAGDQGVSVPAPTAGGAERPGTLVAAEGSLTDPTEAGLARRLLGVWELLAFQRLMDGQVIGDALGPSPVGRLTYESGGYVSALLMMHDRPWREGRAFLNAPEAERGAAALRFIGYSGRYGLRGRTVVHHVDISLYPDHVGTDLVREVDWSGEDLVLLTEERRTPSGRLMRERLVWCRAT